MIDYKHFIEEIVDYLDFGDTYTVLTKNSIFLEKKAIDYLKIIHNDLSNITPIRNRVMHTRPLLGGDFTIVYNFITNINKSDPINWKASIETKELIEQDPSYVLTLKLPITTFSNNTNNIIHNLPIPDFDETGFIGRNKDISDIKQLIFSNKVVSILGEGGIGKTALALKVAYDIIDLNSKCPFELIIWTTAKTTMLTTKGIEQIYSDIKDYTGLISEISKNLAAENKIDCILEYLEVFKTLLIIDNLETIHNEEVRDFIRKAQVKCHILITSRIGLGELEFPKKLTGLTQNESAKLIREIARIRNSDTLLKLPQKTLIEISEKLYFNPLAIKWFVSTVETGISPTEVLNNKEDLLNFCLTNVYEKLSENAISILNTIRASRKKLTIGEIIYLSDFEPLEVRKSLIELHKTTFLNREITDSQNLEEVYYHISDLAKDFLSKNHIISTEYIKAISKKQKALENGIKDIKKISNYNEFSINALSYETANQRIAAKFLQEALMFSKSHNFINALQKITEAKNIDPNYCEVYRVSAFIKATQGDVLGAEEDYKIGLEISPENLRLLFYYAQFLLFSIEDTEKALTLAEKVYQIKPNHPYTALLFARCFCANKDFIKAIETINNLLGNVELDIKNKRVAYTELISLYTNNGKSLFRIETDTENAINQFKKAFEAFEKYSTENSIDSKLLEKFVTSIISFIIALPYTEINNNHQYIKDLILKHEKQILLVYTANKLILKFSDKFNDNQFNHHIDIQTNSKKIMGNIIKVRNDSNYVFIEHNNQKLYANKYDFIDISNWDEWNGITNDQLVSFELGNNSQGECAKNITLVTL